MSEPILVAKKPESSFLLPRMANRHGLIAGATGTGKTVTLQTLAEGFSKRAPLVAIAPSSAAVTVGIAPTGEAVFQYTLSDGSMTRLSCNLLLSQSGATVSLAMPVLCTDSNAEYVSGTGTEAGGVLVFDTETETMATTELRCRRLRHSLTRR